MKVHFGQIYITPGIAFPFSLAFQTWLSEEITAIVKPSETFTAKYGSDWKLIFRISAKTGIHETETRGPTVYKREKHVEYTLFLPFDAIARSGRVPQVALAFLFDGCCHVFRALGIDPSRVEEAAQSISDRICSDPTMYG